MSLLWSKPLEVALWPEGAAWGAAGSRGAVRGAPAEGFSAALASAPRAARIGVTLCGGLAHYLVLEWPAALEDEAESAMYAEHHFRRVFGAAAEEWTVRVDPEEGATRLACAAPRELLEALRASARKAGRRLASVQPFLVASFNRWRRALRAQPALYVTLEPDRWCAALLGGGEWRALRSGRLAREDDPELADLVAREAALAGDADLPVCVHAPAFPRLGVALERFAPRIRVFQDSQEPPHAPAAH